MLFALAAAALLVGAFLIANTFSIVVTQRTRELAVLRAAGATGGQVMRSVLGEALLVGLAASAVGAGLGVACAAGLRDLGPCLRDDAARRGLVVAPPGPWSSRSRSASASRSCRRSARPAAPPRWRRWRRCGARRPT
ncbi:FtsX-like permease family protein, partial [Microbispora sp. GKU 823]|uniref:FtsX-like permease family protein n=1 Tax=Microbispora sp. GKU 823 TaxID=1652100 RepID=UPI00117D429F